MKRRHVLEGVAASIAFSIGVGTVSARRGVSEQSVGESDRATGQTLTELEEEDTLTELENEEDTLTELEGEEDTLTELEEEDTLTELEGEEDTLTELEEEEDTLTALDDDPITDPKDPITWLDDG